MARPMTRHLIAGAAALAVLGLGFLAWNALAPRERDTPVFGPPETIPFPPATVDAVSPAEEPSLSPTESACPSEPALELPPLDDSDEFVRLQIDNCLAAILPADGPTDIVRRVAAVLENASRGELSRGRFALSDLPVGEFRVETHGRRHYIAASTYARYDAVVDALTCVPPERIASLTRSLRPLLARALREFGLPDVDADTMIDSVLATILATQVPALPIEVVEKGALYAYADEELEAASPLTKQLLRLGPDNLAKLQRHAEEVRAARRFEPGCVD